MTRISVISFDPAIYLKGLKKITENIKHNNRCPGCDLKPGAPEYKAVSITIR
jgi:hypothetical protein